MTDAFCRRRNRGRGARSRFHTDVTPLARGERALVVWLGFIVVVLAAAPTTFGAAADGLDASVADDAWRVVVVDVDTGRELWSAPAHVGGEVWYVYTHSADKTPVQSLLRVEAPPVGLVLVLERYLWYGAGLEYRADRGVALDGEWVVVEAERVVGRLPLRVAGTVEQQIVVGHRSTTLGQLAEFGGRVTLEVRP